MICPGGVNTRMHTTNLVDDPIVPLEDLPPVQFRGIATPPAYRRSGAVPVQQRRRLHHRRGPQVDGGGTAAFNIPLR